jgi:NADPH:quinone reductase-like Zn-dependent oxidoreductase
LAPRGTLVAYGLQSQLDAPGNPAITFAKVYAKLISWSLRPNRGRTAVFYNFWGGKIVRSAAFRRRLAEDLTRLVELLRAGKVTGRVGRLMPLAEAAQAMTAAESGTVSGKIVLVP